MIDKHETYVIPYNFSVGTVIAGETYRTRNLVEGLLLAVPSVVLIFVFGESLSFTVKLSISMSVGLPLLLLGVVGVGGDSLSRFLLIFFRYMRRRRTLIYNPRVKHESRPVDLETLHSQMALPRDRMLALIEQYRQKNIRSDSIVEADVLFFEEDIGVMPTPDAYMTNRERRNLKKTQAVKNRKAKR